MKEQIVLSDHCSDAYRDAIRELVNVHIAELEQHRRGRSSPGRSSPRGEAGDLLLHSKTKQLPVDRKESHNSVSFDSKLTDNLLPEERLPVSKSGSALSLMSVDEAKVPISKISSLESLHSVISSRSGAISYSMAPIAVTLEEVSICEETTVDIDSGECALANEDDPTSPSSKLSDCSLELGMPFYTIGWAKLTWRLLRESSTFYSFKPKSLWIVKAERPVLRRATSSNLSLAHVPSIGYGFSDDSIFGRRNSLLLRPEDRPSYVSKMVSDTQSKSTSHGMSCLAGAVLHPHSIKRTIWVMISIMLLSYDAIMIPMQAFDLEPEDHLALWVMLFLTQVFWTLDFFLCFFTGVYTGDNLEMRLPYIALNYSKSWLFMDLVILLPTWSEIIFTDSSAEGGTFKLAKFLRWSRFLRLLRVGKCSAAIKSILLLIYTPGTLLALGVAKYMTALLYLNHVTACVFFVVGKHGWVESYVRGQPLPIQYLTAMHWALTNYQGNSDIYIAISSGGERVFAVVSVWFAVLTLTFFGARLTNVMIQFRALTKERMEERAVMLDYLSKHNIPQELGARINYFLKWKNEKYEEDAKIQSTLKSLPRNLLTDLLFEVHSPLLRGGHHLFYNLLNQHPRIVRRICHDAITSMSWAPGDFVFQQMETCSHMYFVESGVLLYTMWVESTVVETPGRKKLREQEVLPKDTLSEACLWIDLWHHHGDLLVIRSTPILLGLEAHSFEKIFNSYPAAVRDLVPYVRAFMTALHKRNPYISDMHFLFDELEDADWVRKSWQFPRTSLGSVTISQQLGSNARWLLNAFRWRKRRPSVEFT